jgi:hypothetical protein
MRRLCAPFVILILAGCTRAHPEQGVVRSAAPLVTTALIGTVKEIAPPDAGSSFGRAVAIDGDLLVVGMPSAGTAYVFSKDQGGAGAWGRVATLTVPSPDSFGASVAVSGDVVVVGDPKPYAGSAAYVFLRDRGGAGAWGLAKTLVPSDGASGDRFAHAVAVSGETVAVGMPALQNGRVYLFSRSAGGPDAFGQVKELRSTDPGAYFGAAVALSGDELAVGAPFKAGATEVEVGEVTLHARNSGSANGWGVIKTFGPQAEYYRTDFGISVALSGDVLAAGSWRGGVAHGGTFDAFGRDKGGADAWGRTGGAQALYGTDELGRAVAIAPGAVIVGVPDAVVGNPGDARMYWQRPDLSWTSRAFAPANLGADAEYGSVLAASGRLVVVGAPKQSTSGRVYVYTVDATDDCAPNPCRYGGVCTDGLFSFTCACAKGYSGPTCGAFDCQIAACRNAGTCTGNGNTTCVCGSGWTGPSCLDVDYCASTSCQNGGVCANGPTSAVCTCASGWAGATCADVDHCVGAPCQNGGGCVNGPTNYTCSCAPHYSGATCGVYDPCSPTPCANGGTCAASGNDFTCSCPAGFTGSDCSAVDYCAGSPCQHGGTCTNGLTGFTCECLATYTGATCAADVDECAGPSPCDPNATCSNTVGSFSCTCNAGYSGDGFFCVAGGSSPAGGGGGGGGGCGTSGGAGGLALLPAVFRALRRRGRDRE